MRIHVNGSDAEVEMVRKMAYAAGMTISEFMRSLIHKAYAEYRNPPPAKPAVSIKKEERP